MQCASKLRCREVHLQEITLLFQNQTIISGRAFITNSPICIQHFELRIGRRGYSTPDLTVNLFFSCISSFIMSLRTHKDSSSASFTCFSSCSRALSALYHGSSALPGHFGTSTPTPSLGLSQCPPRCGCCQGCSTERHQVEGSH